MRTGIIAMERIKPDIIGISDRQVFGNVDLNKKGHGSICPERSAQCQYLMDKATGIDIGLKGRPFNIFHQYRRHKNKIVGERDGSSGHSIKMAFQFGKTGFGIGRGRAGYRHLIFQEVFG
jgi:hypothetical protein